MGGAPDQSRAAHIVLIGLRCSGKSTLAPRLAETLGVACVDLDDRVARAMGAASPAQAIENNGIESFRAAEAHELDSALGEPASVLALGGGTPTAPGARERLERAATTGQARVFYLCAQPGTLEARMRATDTGRRPALEGDDPVAEIATIHAQRHQLYETLAESIVETDAVEPESVLAALVALAKAGA